MKNFLGRIRQRKLNSDYVTENPPIFSLSPEFKPLTYDQRKLLYYLVKASKEEAYDGEFQWCIEAIPDNAPPLNFIVGIKPVILNTNTFDINNPMFLGKKWSLVIKRAQMKALEDGEYISVSPLPERISDDKNSKVEVWVNFCLNQKAYDYYRFTNRSAIRRLFHILWISSQKHFITIVISIISGVLGAFLISRLIDSP